MESWGIPLDFSHEMDRFLLKPMATLLREWSLEPSDLGVPFEYSTTMATPKASGGI